MKKINQQVPQDALQEQQEKQQEDQEQQQQQLQSFNKPGPMTILGLCVFTAGALAAHIMIGNAIEPFHFLHFYPTFWYGSLGGFLTHITHLHAKDAEKAQKSPALLSNNKKKGTSSIIYVGADVALAILLVCVYFSRRHAIFIYFGVEGNPWYIWGPTTAIVCTALLYILEIVGTKTLISTFLQSPFLNYVGEKSYSIYIYHAYICMAVKYEIHLPEFDKLWLVVFFSIVVGSILSKFIETPGVRLGEFLIAKSLAILRRKKESTKKSPNQQNAVAETPDLVNKITSELPSPGPETPIQP